jgi:hypothetical protein
MIIRSAHFSEFDAVQPNKNTNTEATKDVTLKIAAKEIMLLVP